MYIPGMCINSSPCPPPPLPFPLGFQRRGSLSLGKTTPPLRLAAAATLSPQSQNFNQNVTALVLSLLIASSHPCMPFNQSLSTAFRSPMSTAWWCRCWWCSSDMSQAAQELQCVEQAQASACAGHAQTALRLRPHVYAGNLAFPKGLSSGPGRPRVPPKSPVIFDVQLVLIPGQPATLHCMLV